MDSLLVIHGVGPHQITENTIERNLMLSIDLVNLLNLFKAG